MYKSNEFHILDSQYNNPQRLKKEREKARKLKKSQWWLQILNRGLCSYCQKKVPANQLTMDHIVPLARGGESKQGNIVAACFECNQNKKLDTPVEQILRQLAQENSEENKGTKEIHD